MARELRIERLGARYAYLETLAGGRWAFIQSQNQDSRIGPVFRLVLGGQVGNLIEYWDAGN